MAHSAELPEGQSLVQGVGALKETLNPDPSILNPNPGLNPTFGILGFLFQAC